MLEADNLECVCGERRLLSRYRQGAPLV